MDISLLVGYRARKANGDAVIRNNDEGEVVMDYAVYDRITGTKEFYTEVIPVSDLVVLEDDFKELNHDIKKAKE